MFSHYFTYLFQRLQFILIIVGRFFKILFRRKRGIELLYLDYSDEHIFDNSYIILKYRFRNALWYRFGNHKTLEKQIKIFNLKNFDKEFDFVVYGFFKKRIYKLKFDPKLALINSQFKTTISNLSLKFEKQNIPKLAHPSIYCDIDRPIIKASKIKINNNRITIKNNTYNQNEFI